jgi:hypothetical protein
LAVGDGQRGAVRLRGIGGDVARRVLHVDECRRVPSGIRCRVIDAGEVRIPEVRQWHRSRRDRRILLDPLGRIRGTAVAEVSGKTLARGDVRDVDRPGARRVLEDVRGHLIAGTYPTDLLLGSREDLPPRVVRPRISGRVLLRPGLNEVRVGVPVDADPSRRHLL